MVSLWWYLKTSVQLPAHPLRLDSERSELASVDAPGFPGALHCARRIALCDELHDVVAGLIGCYTPSKTHLQLNSWVRCVNKFNHVLPEVILQNRRSHVRYDNFSSGLIDRKTEDEQADFGELCDDFFGSNHDFGGIWFRTPKTGGGLVVVGSMFLT